MSFISRSSGLLCTRTLSRCPTTHLLARCASNKSASSSAKSLPSPRPDYARILADPAATARNAVARQSPLSMPADALVSRVGELHAQVATLQNRFQVLRSERNSLGKLLARSTGNEDARKRADQIRSELGGVDGVEAQLERSQDELLKLALELPNCSSPDSPEGGYEACKVERTTDAGGVPAMERPNPLADHVELMTALGWLYMPNHITGSSWPYLIKGGALLEHALIQYGLAKAIERGFEPVCPPDVIKHEIMSRCGFQPRDSGGEAQTYFVSTDGEAGQADLALAATAEIPLAGYFMDTLYKTPAKDLPRMLIASGHAFRAEAGARGKESRGLYRVHQFTKLELFAVTSSEGDESRRMLDSMVDLQWDILAGLKLPLRLLNMSTTELGGSAYKKYDVEAYMPGRASWGELASASNCTDYQARRLAVRHRSSGRMSSHVASAEPVSTNAYCHTLNATAIAVPRVIVALIESGATFDEEGRWRTLRLPQSLQKHWIGKETKDNISTLRITPTTAMAKRGQPTTVELHWV